eukprot:1136270-Pelagomonas_calceolata.AAC.1
MWQSEQRQRQQQRQPALQKQRPGCTAAKCTGCGPVCGHEWVRVICGVGVGVGVVGGARPKM